jgi:hypothetical protein
MCVRDDQSDATQGASGETVQDLDPERFGFAGADRHAQHVAPAVGIELHGDNHRH